MEIKILCPCGTKFKFQVEPVNGQSPAPVHCPACGQDSTEATNALIRQQLSASASGVPAIRIPAMHSSAAVHVSPPVPIATAAPSPAASIGPKVTVMPVPQTTKALSVKPPGEATSTEAPPSSPAPSNASGDAKAPGSPKMAFMPVPVGGTGSALSVSGGYGKKDEKPEEAAAAPQAVAEPVRVHPASAKMAAPPAPPSATGGNLGMGITGAAIGCLIGAGIWYFIAVNFAGIRLLAWIPGVVGGVGAVLFARKTSESLGTAAAVVAGIITILAQIAVIAGINDKRLTEASEDSYKETIAIAKKAADAKTDDQVRKVMDEDPGYNGLHGSSLKEILKEVVAQAEKAQREEANKAAGKEPGDAEEIAEYRKKRLPELVKFSQGEPSRSRFIEKERTRLEEDGEILYEKKYISMGIWIFSSIEAAFLIGRGKKKQ